ncbi:hypothetical protein [Azospirillum sp. HJ39]|uniref:hypothetical protein n=1 Tax=Azospirillum sp. HJ39 TaxID=3159496 RepID=UPI00355832AA
MDDDKIVTVHPQGRFKADNRTALAAAAVAGLGVACLPDCPPDCLVEDHIASGAPVPVMLRHPLPPGVRR